MLEGPQASRRFAVALSFERSQRDYARAVAALLKDRLGDERVFFDEDLEAHLNGLDVDLPLAAFYREATLVVTFLSEAYARSPWCRLEWRQIRALASTDDKRRLMLFRFDPIELTRLGLAEIDWAADATQRPEAEIVALILARLQLIAPELPGLPRPPPPIAPEAAAEIDRLVEAYQDDHKRYRRLAQLVGRYLASRVAGVLGRPAETILQHVESAPMGAARVRQVLRYEAEREAAGEPHRYRSRAGTLELGDLGGLAIAHLIFFSSGDLDRFARAADLFDQWLGAGSQPVVSGAGATAEPDGADYRVDVTVVAGTPLYLAMAEPDQRELIGHRAEVHLRTVLRHARIAVDARPDARAPEAVGPTIGDVAPDAGYEVLRTEPPKITYNWLLFSIDDAMRVEGYKADVWRQLPKRFRDGLVRDNLISRVKDWRDDTIEVQPARYSDQMVSNHGAAHAIKVDDITVASRAQRDGALLPLGQSPLSNTLGVAAMVRTIDQRWVVPLRASHPIYEPDKLGCSVSSVVDWWDPNEWKSDEADWWRQILAACEQELGFRPQRASIAFLALTREVQRLGKPQIFLLIQEPRLKEQVRDYCRLNRDGEHDPLFLDDVAAARLSRAETFEGRAVAAELRMNLHLALQFLRKP